MPDALGATCLSRRITPPPLLCSPSRKPQGHRCPDAIALQRGADTSDLPPEGGSRRPRRAGAIGTRDKEDPCLLIEGGCFRNTLGERFPGDSG